MSINIDVLPEKVIKSLCPNQNCSEIIDFTYIALEYLEHDLVYWQASCQRCGCDKSGVAKIGFQNI